MRENCPPANYAVMASGCVVSPLSPPHTDWDHITNEWCYKKKGKKGDSLQVSSYKCHSTSEKEMRAMNSQCWVYSYLHCLPNPLNTNTGQLLYVGIFIHMIIVCYSIVFIILLLLTSVFLRQTISNITIIIIYLGGSVD